MASAGKRKGAPAEKAPNIRISHGTYQKVLVKRTFTAILSMFLIVLALYIIFAATWIRVVPALSGPTLIKNNTYSGGIVPVGETVLISNSQELNDGVLDKLQQAFVPQKGVSKVQVLAGPLGKVDWSSSGVTSVDGNVLPIKFPEDPGFNVDPEKTGYLIDKYLAVCISGDCEKDEPMSFGPKNIYGIPLAKADFEQDVDVEGLNDAEGSKTGRPAAEDIAVWVKFENANFNDKQVLCVAKVYESSKVTNDMLTYAIDQSIAGQPADLVPEDQALVDEVKASKAYSTCVAPAKNKGKK